MKSKILLSTFACNPYQGGEPSNGWNMAVFLSKKYEVHCLVRMSDKFDIEKEINLNIYDNLHFHFVKIPYLVEKCWNISFWGVYITYLFWQYYAYLCAAYLHKIHKFSLVHHVSWGSMQLGSFMYKLDTKLIIGPIGGGQKSNIILKSFFEKYWIREKLRNFISQALILLNPACKNALKKASFVLVSNLETFEAVKKIKGSDKNIIYYFPSLSSFFKIDSFPKRQQNDVTNVLWLGRLLPRKGLGLAIEAFKRLSPESNIKLTIVGEGEMEKQIAEIISASNLSDRVKLLGRVPFSEIKNTYLASDIFLFSSLRDSVGAQIIEAMSTGLPVIGLNMHGQGLVINEQTGLKVEVTTVENIIEGLKNNLELLHKDKVLRQNLSHGAYIFGQNQLWKNKIVQIEKIYKLTMKI